MKRTLCTFLIAFLANLSCGNIFAQDNVSQASKLSIKRKAEMLASDFQKEFEKRLSIRQIDRKFFDKNFRKRQVRSAGERCRSIPDKLYFGRCFKDFESLIDHIYLSFIFYGRSTKMYSAGRKEVERDSKSSGTDDNTVAEKPRGALAEYPAELRNDLKALKNWSQILDSDTKLSTSEWKKASIEFDLFHNILRTYLFNKSPLWGNFDKPLKTLRNNTDFRQVTKYSYNHFFLKEDEKVYRISSFPLYLYMIEENGQLVITDIGVMVD